MIPSSRPAADRFLAYYDEVRRIHKQDTGQELREYKPTESGRLVGVFEGLWSSQGRGADLLGELLHALVWSQCLGNANHRTSVLFLEGILTALDVPFPFYGDESDAEPRFKAAIERFSESSHKLLDRQSEFGFNPAQLRTQHRRLCQNWLEEQLGPQSRVDTIVDPQRLMAFFS